jgi:hypothetical protein
LYLIFLWISRTFNSKIHLWLYFFLSKWSNWLFKKIKSDLIGWTIIDNHLSMCNVPYIMFTMLMFIHYNYRILYLNEIRYVCAPIFKWQCITNKVIYKLYTYIYKIYFYFLYKYISKYTNILVCVYIYIYRRANDSSRTSRVELIQAELTSFVRAEPSLYEYVSFNIRACHCVHEQLIYFSNRDRIEFKWAESSRIREQPGSSNTPICYEWMPTTLSIFFFSHWAALSSYAVPTNKKNDNYYETHIRIGVQNSNCINVTFL